MTPFVRILIIFHFLRQALGTQTAPSNQTLIGLALFLTYFIMQPVGIAVHAQAVIPFEHGKVTTLEALDRRLRSAAQLHAQLRARKRSSTFRGNEPGSPARKTPTKFPCVW